MADARRRRILRGASYIQVLAGLRGHEAWLNSGSKIHVTLVRICASFFDDDNLAASFKSVRDGIADALGLKDNDPRLAWNYRQAKPMFTPTKKKMVGSGIRIDFEVT